MLPVSIASGSLLSTSQNLRWNWTSHLSAEHMNSIEGTLLLGVGVALHLHCHPPVFRSVFSLELCWDLCVSFLWWRNSIQKACMCGTQQLQLSTCHVLLGCWVLRGIGTQALSGQLSCLMVAEDCIMIWDAS